MIVDDWMVRIASPAGVAWRQQWLAGLPARLVVAIPAVLALALAGNAATAANAGSWATWIGLAGVAGYLLFGARPGPAIAAVATVPAAVTVLMLLATPLRLGLVLGECGLLLTYVLLLERWEAPGGRYQRRLALLLPGLALAAALMVAGLFVAGGAGGSSMAVAVLGLGAALAAAALTVKAGRFR